MIEIDDAEMMLIGKRIKYNLYMYNSKVLRMIKTHQSKNVSYYVLDKG